MSKEEYLNIYKEDKLAELCEKKDEEIDCIRKSLASVRSELESAKKYQDAFSDMKKLEDMIKKLPADEFLKLYFSLEQLVDRSKYCYTTLSTSGLTTVSARGY